MTSTEESPRPMGRPRRAGITSRKLMEKIRSTNSMTFFPVLVKSRWIREKMIRMITMEMAGAPKS